MSGESLSLLVDFVVFCADEKKLTVHEGALHGKGVTVSPNSPPTREMSALYRAKRLPFVFVENKKDSKPRKLLKKNNNVPHTYVLQHPRFAPRAQKLAKFNRPVINIQNSHTHFLQD